MTNGDYVRHFAVLGKYAYLFDIAGADQLELELLLARTADQVANANVDDLDPVQLFAARQAQYRATIRSGSVAQQSLAKSMAQEYLVTDRFIDSLTTAPTNPNDPKSVLAALQTEMGAGVDNKTLTTKAATGLVNFFDEILADAGTWNTDADVDADYKDSVYVVSAVV